MSGRVPQLETQPQSSENVDCTDRPWDWKCQVEKYQTNTSPVPDTPGAADIGAATERSIIKMTMNTESSGLLHSTVQSSVGYERSTLVVIDGASGSVTAGGSEDGSQDTVSLALHAALAALGVLIVLLIILIVYFGYFRKRQRGQGTDSENGSGMDNYAYSKHKRIPYSLQENRLSVIPELSEHDSESQYEYVEPASGTHLNLPTFLVTDHSMNPAYDYSEPDNQTENLNPSADEEGGLYDYVDPATVHTKFSSSKTTLTGVVNPAHIEIDTETSFQSITTDTESKDTITSDSETNEPIPTEPESNLMTESESSSAPLYQAMLPSNDLNQHVYASSCDVESISTEPTTATPAYSEPVSDSTSSAASTPAAAVDNYTYNICEEEEPEEDNSVYELLSDGETNNNSS